MIGNITETEFLRRLRLLETQKADIEKYLDIRRRPLYHRVGVFAEPEPTIYYEQEEDRAPEQVILKPLDTMSDDESSVNDSQLPDWVEQLFAHQQSLLEHLAQNNGPHRADNRPIRAEYIYKFTPLDLPDDTDYFFFCERIEDTVQLWGEERVLPTLVACLDNTRAKTWYASLSPAEKQALRESTDTWKDLLKRDFGIKPFRAKQLAQRETFAFAQGRPVLQYLEMKLACLRIAGIQDEDLQCAEIREGLRDAEFRSAIRLRDQGNTTAWLRQELTTLEPDIRAVCRKKTYAQPPPTIARFANRGTPFARGARGSGYGRGTYGNRGSTSTFVPRGGATTGGTMRGAGNAAGGYGRGGSPNRGRGGYPYTAGASESRTPRPCRYCGGRHWDRECQFAKPEASAYHCYNVDLSVEDYETAEYEYAVQESNYFNDGHFDVDEDFPFAEERESFAEVYDDSYLNEDQESYYYPPPPSKPWHEIQTAKTPSTQENLENATATIFFTNMPAASCTDCGAEFSSRNKLFQHLQEKIHFQKEEQSVRKDLQIVSSTAPTQGVGTGSAFRDFNYTEIQYSLTPNEALQWGCADSGSGMSLIGENRLNQIPWRKRTLSQQPINIKGVNGGPLKVWESVILDVYLPDHTKEKLAHIRREFHVIPQLDCGIILGNDCLVPEDIVIKPAKRIAIIGSCQKMVCPIRVTPRRKVDKHVVRCAKDTTIAPNSFQVVPIRFKQLKVDQTLVFQPVTLNQYLPDGTYAMRALARADQDVLLVTNLNDKPITIKRGVKIGTMNSLDEGHDTRKWDEASKDMDVYLQTEERPRRQTPIEVNNSRKETPLTDKKKGSAAVNINTTDDITPSQIAALRQVLQDHEKLFADHLGIAKEPMSDWLKIPLLPGAEEKLKPTKPYYLGPKERQCVDEVLDEQRRQGRIEDCPGSPVGWPIFVTKKGSKWRPVIDLRGLNKYIAPDAYPLPRQEDIVNAICDCYWLGIFDIRSAYYQRWVHPQDRWKLAIASHRGHEQINVAPMGLALSVAHQQRYMDKILRKVLWRIAACFIDDVVVFSKTFEQHLRDLDEVLAILEESGMTVQPYKCFVGYHSLRILGILVDRFGLTTLEERAQAISQAKYPTTLDQLDYFLGATGWNRSLIPYYAQITSPLQALKTKLYKEAPKSGTARKRFSQKTKVPEPNVAQKKSFQLVKDVITSRQTMAHMKYDQPFYFYIDASREMGYGIAVYQEDTTLQKEGRMAQRPVMFLSRELKQAEKTYWPTELEAGGLIWAIQKLKHIVEGSKVIVYTDHKASEAISKMTTLRTTSPGRSNLRLANWALLLSQYWANLDIRYVKGIQNVMADALSRLRTKALDISQEERNALALRERLDDIDIVTGFHVKMDVGVPTTLLQLEEEFKTRLIKGYESDVFFGPILRILRKYYGDNKDKVVNGMISRPYSPYHLLFPVDNPLIFYKDPVDGRYRLCISQAVQKEILHLAHDRENHFGVSKTYARLIASYFIPHLLRTVKVYISRCPQCAINRTLRNKPNGLLKPIEASPTPFHTLTMDFIVSLPPSKRFAHGDETFDAILTVTDKFTKAVKLLPGKGTYTAMDWAKRYWQDVYPDWGFPNVIISDRDAKFLSEFWKTLFRKAGTKILTSTAYHPQTDGQSERTNQTVEIALRYYVSPRQNDWADALDVIQGAIMTAIHATTGKSPGELLYGLNPRHALDLANPDLPKSSVSDDWAKTREVLRAEAKDAITHAQALMKLQADKHRRDFQLKPGDKVYLRLHQGYHLPGIPKPKIGQQRAGPYEVEAVIGANAYKLKIPEKWKIWPVISGIYLDKAPGGPDPFGRDEAPRPVTVAEDDPENVRWEVAAIINKKITGRKNPKIWYLVRWTGLNADQDVWLPESELAGCARLIRDYEKDTGNPEWSPPRTWGKKVEFGDGTSDDDETGNEEKDKPAERQTVNTDEPPNAVPADTETLFKRGRPPQSDETHAPQRSEEEGTPQQNDPCIGEPLHKDQPSGDKTRRSGRIRIPSEKVRESQKVAEGTS